MEHEQFTEWLYLSVFDELDGDAKRALDDHVQSCEDCRREREKLVGMLDTIAASGVGEPSDALLANARRSLRAELWKESQALAAASRPAEREPLSARLFGSVRDWLENAFGGRVRLGYRVGLAAAATLSIGFLIGYVTFNTAPTGPPVVQPQPAENDLYTGIANIQFLDVDATDGQVDIIYDQVRPVHLKTTVADQRAQDVLSYALLNDKNPGVRLKALSAFESYEIEAPPEDMKQVFLEALTSDPNAGVRLQALLVLRRLPFDENVKKTLMYVMSHDDNPGIRIAVLNYLAETTIEGKMPEQEMYDILGGKMMSE